MRVLIIGCGYLGRALGASLARDGHEVFGVRRNSGPEADLGAVGIRPLTADITKPADLAALPAPFDWVVNCVSSSKGGVDEYREVYFNGVRNLIHRLAPCLPKKFIHISSSSVYGQADGSLVKETSATEPASDTSKILVETEKLLLAATAQQKIPAIVLRAAGIYGESRGHLFQQFLNNEARITGKGERHINMIHRDDLVGVIQVALKNGRAGEIYNAVDDEPVTQLHFFRWLAETLGKWMPPFATEAEASQRKRGLTNKKVSNRKLKMELGYQFRHPTFRQGYTEEIRRLENAGLLNIQPDPR